MIVVSYYLAGFTCKLGGMRPKAGAPRLKRPLFLMPPSQGAACMNNTFCLGVFMFLIFFRSLAWEFSAETVSILLVQVSRWPN